MTGARLRSTAGSGLAPVICCLTVRKKTGVGGGVGNPLPSIQSRERFCTLKKRLYRFTGALILLIFANGVRSGAKRRGSLPVRASTVFSCW